MKNDFAAREAKAFRGWDTPQSSLRSQAEQGRSWTQVPSPGWVLFPSSRGVARTPPPKALRKFPPSAHPGRVGRGCGAERTEETTSFSSQHTETAFCDRGRWGRAEIGGVKTPDAGRRDSWCPGGTTLGLPARGGHLSPGLSPLRAVAALGRPAGRASPKKRRTVLALGRSGRVAASAPPLRFSKVEVGFFPSRPRPCPRRQRR